MSGSNSSAPVSAATARSEAEPLAMTVHSLPDPQAAGQQQRTRAGRWSMLLVVLACAAPVLASYFTFSVIQPSGKAYGELINPTVDLPPPAALQLRDLAGQPVAVESLKGQWLLTLVQDMPCDTACDERLFTQRQLREMLGKERDKVDKLLLIPEESAVPPAALQQALSAGVPVTVLRAPRAQIEAWLKPATGRGLQDHFYVIDPMGRWMMRSPVKPEPGKFKNDLNRLLKANAGWDTPGR